MISGVILNQCFVFVHHNLEQYVWSQSKAMLHLVLRCPVHSVGHHFRTKLQRNNTRKEKKKYLQWFTMRGCQNGYVVDQGPSTELSVPEGALRVLYESHQPRLGMWRRHIRPTQYGKENYLKKLQLLVLLFFMCSGLFEVDGQWLNLGHISISLIAKTRSNF